MKYICMYNSRSNFEYWSNIKINQMPIGILQNPNSVLVINYNIIIIVYYADIIILISYDQQRFDDDYL